jgi:hypothetical protein
LGTVTITIVGWDTQLNGDSMTGSWNEHVTSSAIAGFVQWIDTIDTVVKASANQATASSEEHGQPGDPSGSC